MTHVQFALCFKFNSLKIVSGYSAVTLNLVLTMSNKVMFTNVLSLDPDEEAIQRRTPVRFGKSKTMIFGWFQTAREFQRKYWIFLVRLE